jgi:uncharacterized membrane protein YfhO
MKGIKTTEKLKNLTILTPKRKKITFDYAKPKNITTERSLFKQNMQALREKDKKTIFSPCTQLFNHYY